MSIHYQKTPEWLIKMHEQKKPTWECKDELSFHLSSSFCQTVLNQWMTKEWILETFANIKKAKIIGFFYIMSF